MTPPFLDTNVFLRHLLQDEPGQSPRATAYLARIERGEIQAQISDLVIFELVFTLQRTYRRSKETIRDVLLPFLDLPGILLPGKRRFRRVFDLYIDRNISFADAYHVELMERLKLNEVVSFDRDFDRVVGLWRVEP
ncbi:MAG TPA: PIN domain-containing protein [Dehalococcoidia bacterium]|nr:PIN domain-containing protein [Dehalococcoidia bacterium]